MSNTPLKHEDNQQGMDQKRDIPNENLEQTNDAADGGHQGRASFHSGSTTQGGSNFGQGSSQLGGQAYHQGDTGNTGSNYDNEADRLAKSGAQDVARGQGLSGNEQETGAQEEYPGPLSEEHEEDLDTHSDNMK
jgi:hypothetical protein